jgi:hypothetical protein
MNTEQQLQRILEAVQRLASDLHQLRAEWRQAVSPK